MNAEPTQAKPKAEKKGPELYVPEPRKGHQGTGRVCKTCGRSLHKHAAFKTALGKTYICDVALVTEEFVEDLETGELVSAGRRVVSEDELRNSFLDPEKKPLNIRTPTNHCRLVHKSRLKPGGDVYEWISENPAIG